MKNLLLLLISVFSLQTLSMPAQIILMRHGEKPEEGDELSEQGWARAKALPNLFDRKELKSKPFALFAMKRKSKSDGSIRPIQTLKYVSEKFNLTINTPFKKDQVIDLVQQIRNDSNLNEKTIVICWEHKVLRDIARELGLNSPPDWSGDVYDRLWLLNFSASGDLVKFQNLPERLLPSDSRD